MSAVLSGCRLPCVELGELAPSISCDDRQPAQSLMQLVAQVSKAGTAWVDKVQLFGLLCELLQGPGCTPHADVAANAERVAACLLDGVGECAAGGLVGRHAEVGHRLRIRRELYAGRSW